MPNNKIGVMQGRLLPKYKGRYQAHPVGYWENEFNIAKNIGLDTIEFILDFNEYKKNPLISNSGNKEIQHIVQNSGVSVDSICADYFMEAPLHSKDENVSNISRNVLINLLKKSLNIGVNDIVIPCVDNSTISNCKTRYNNFVKSLMPIIPIAEEVKVNLCLETDLAPKEFAKLISVFDSQVVKVNYDIGNSAALGYDSDEELELYGNRISDIHIKDRLKGGGPVLLGEGNADFDKFFKKLNDINYDGIYIMQAFRDDEGINVFIEQLKWIRKYFIS